MTRSAEIPEAAVVAAAKAVSLDYQKYLASMRLALAAALPYLAPAGDGGLREALEKALESPVELWHENSFRVKALPETDVRELLAAHPAAPAVLQPVDREALMRMFLQTFEDGGLWDGLEPEAYKVRWRTKWAATFTDRVLAVLAGEQEQVET